MLSFSSLIIIAVGSIALVKCLRKKAQKAAKMAKKLGKAKSNDGALAVLPSKKAQVHPLSSSALS